MQNTTESGNDPDCLSEIFESPGLTKIAQNELPINSAPKRMICCNNCKKPVTRKQAAMRNVIYALNKIWHRDHFTCIRCKRLVGYNERPFRKCRSNRNYPICVDCYMEEYHPKCNVCNKALRETYVKAMDKLWHRCCFTCTKCSSPFADGEFLIYNEQPYDIDCYHLTKYANEFTPTVNRFEVSIEPGEMDDFMTDEQLMKSVLESSDKTESTETKKFPFMTPPPELSKSGFGSESSLLPEFTSMPGTSSTATPETASTAMPETAPPKQQPQ